MTEREFGQEYLCEFNEVDGGIFDPAAVRDMFDESGEELVIDCALCEFPKRHSTE